MKNLDLSFFQEDCNICITGGSGFIGSNLIKILKKNSKKTKILNLDLIKPIKNSQVTHWHKCDLNNRKELVELICNFKPKYIIHLAADATMTGKNLEGDYKTNIVGVKNLIDAVRNLPEETFLIVASSQHVKKPGSFIYTNSLEYAPLGLYGQSKVITEELIKKANLKQNWFIVRPTLVWGPENIVMANTIFNYINKNIYFHPTNDNTVRSYGYVDNVCYQILRICALEFYKLDDRVFYLADSNLLQKEWIFLANKLMEKGETKTISKTFLKTLSYFGDFCRKVYPKFPVYTERFLNLTTSNPVPLDKTFYYLGMPPVGLYDAMENTTIWLKKYYSKKK